MKPYARVFLSVALLGAAVAAARPATAEDLATLRSRSQALADEVSALERRRADLEIRSGRLEEEIAASDHRIAALELEIDAAEHAHRAALEAYVERAVEAYKSGGATTQLALILEAKDLGDAFTLAEASRRSAELDSAAVEKFVAARDDARAAQDRIDERKQRLLAARAEVQEIEGRIDENLARRRSTLEELSAEVEKIEAKIRRQAAVPQPPPPPTAANDGIGPLDKAMLEKLSGAGPSNGIPDGFRSTGVDFEGLASWYGPGFEGNPTASGDIFDSRLYTAASKELPLGTWLYIEHEGRGVVVLINDRGPYVEPRILDLSKASAEALQMVGKGVGWVRATIIVRL